MSSYPSLSTLPLGLNVPTGEVSHSHASMQWRPQGNDDVAQAFGFTGDSLVEARLLTVPSASGDNALQLEARFLNHLFSRD